MMVRRQFLSGAAALGASTIWQGGFSAEAKQSEDARLTLRATEVRRLVHPSFDQASRLFLYNGMSPGPTIRSRRGERLEVIFRNDLGVPSTVHWHGIRLDNAMDGVPMLTQSPVLPQGRFQYEFNLPDAGTYWYHAHTNSMEQVARGLYGPLIVEGDAEELFDHDITLILDDWWLNDDGTFVDGFENWLQGKQGGRIGNVFTVNGGSFGSSIKLQTGSSVRLRLINAANAREFFLDASSLDSQIIAVDGQPLPEPETVRTPIRLGPAQRIDLGFITHPKAPMMLTELSGTLSDPRGQQQEAIITRFEVGGNESGLADIPRLSQNAIPEPNYSPHHNITLHMEGGSLNELSTAYYGGQRVGQNELRRHQQVWAFNGFANLPQSPLFRSMRGETVFITMINDTGWSHAMHIHGHHFRVIEGRNDRPARSWQDTVMIDRKQKITIAFVADNPGKWLLHCHMLQHAAAGMNTWFHVV